MSSDKCGKCGLNEEESEDGALWTHCSSCDVWFHNICEEITRQLEEAESYVCNECNEQKELNDLLEKQKRLEIERKNEENHLIDLKNKKKKKAEENETLAANKRIKEERKLRMLALKAKIEQESNALEVLKKETIELEKSLSESDNADYRLENHVEENVSYSNRNRNNESSVVMQLLEQQARLVNRQYLLELPEFDGNSEAWPLFIAQYRSSTQEGLLNQAENLNRLRKCLKGKARKAVEGLLALLNNIDQVMEILEMSFGGMEVLVKAKLKALRDLASVNENKPATVKSFFEFILNTKASLINANAAGYVNSPQLLDNLIEKLPPNMERSWIKHKIGCGISTLDEFINWLKPTYQCSVLQDCDTPNTKTQRVNTHVDEEAPGLKKCRCCHRVSHTLAVCEKFKKMNLRRRWEFLKRNRLCFICILAKHYSKDCAARKPCNVDGCIEYHNPLLHKNQRKEPEIVSHHHDDPTTYYRLLPVKLFNGEHNIVVWAFLDEGSGPTLISESAVERLNLDGPASEICLKWSDGKIQQQFSSKRVNLEISGLVPEKRYLLREVQSTPVLDLPLPHDMINLKAKYKHLQDVPLSEVTRMKPDLLIGLQHVKLMLPQRVKEGRWGAPVASLTKLGWTIYGKDHTSRYDQNMYSCHICECYNGSEKLESILREFHTTESFGVTIPKKQMRSDEDEIAMKILKETLKFKNGHYEVGLLWKNPEVTLPDNRSMALRRLYCFERKLKKNPILRAAVMNKFEENVKNGYVRKADPREIENFNGRKWFLPMFSVHNPYKPSKIRLVYDAAAKFEGVSLNDLLLKGPDNQKSIFGVLIRGRRGEIALSGDIRDFYHRVMVRKEDQYCQLVYWRNLQQNISPDIYIINVLLMGGTCSSSSANEAKNTNAAKFKSRYPRAFEAITEAHYADDYFDSVNTSEEAIELGKQVTLIHRQAGFEIRNWVSNDTKVVKALECNQEANVEVDLSYNKIQREEKILGLYWNVVDDCFLFKVSYARVDPAILDKRRVPTKREVVRVVMSPYDPMGMLAPIIIAAKTIVQSLWRSGCNWDDAIPNEILPAWENWLDALQNIIHIKVPRWYSSLLPQSSNIDLHLFADSSELAFAAVGNLRIEHDDNVNVSFVASKTRVAPQKTLSIPRLELQAAVLATRLMKTICQEINVKINRVIMWTDSQTVLGWLRSTHRRYSSFVSHRVSEVLESSDLKCWRWVPSKKNVADDATKWENMPRISDRWFSGPEFLQHPETEWPVEQIKISETNEEERSIQYHAVHRQVIDKYSFINSNRFSNWTRLLRSIVFVRRYIQSLRVRLSQKNRCKLNCSNNLEKMMQTIKECTGYELEAAKEVLIKKCQIESNPDEILELSKGKKISKRSKIYKLMPFLDGNGIMRAYTRLDAAPFLIDPATKNPIILDGKHHITCLIIKSVHLRFHHRSKETVINELRQLFWIPKIRVHVNRIINQCYQCAVDRTKPHIPRMANLPVERLSPYLPPYTNTGVDFMGPLFVTVGRRREKRWICLFTCMTMRAIHLEVASSLDTSSCVMCFRNFMNRHGRPHLFLSDNGTNFKATEKELKLMMKGVDWNEIQAKSQPSDISDHYINWKYIPPAAPHFGGAWERMVRTVKDTLYRILKSHVPKEETFRSAIIEVEAIVNSRPLNYSSTEDINEPAITPNMLIRKSNHEPPNCHDLSSFDSRKQWVVSQQIAQEFWNRWVLEYLPTIANRSKWYDDKKPLCIGQLVLIVDNNMKRCEWRRGIIIDTLKGVDGRIRSATVKTAKGNLIRPVSKLAVIKVNIPDHK